LLLEEQHKLIVQAVTEETIRIEVCIKVPQLYDELKSGLEEFLCYLVKALCMTYYLVKAHPHNKSTIRNPGRCTNKTEANKPHAA
jgi:hypothetical protein